MFDNVTNRVKNAANSAKATLSDTANSAKATLSDTANSAKTTILNTTDSVKKFTKLNVRLVKYTADFIEGLVKIANEYRTSPNNINIINNFAPLVAQDFTSRLQAIMIYMDMKKNDKIIIVDEIKKILTKFEDAPMTDDNQLDAIDAKMNGGRKRKTKKRRRY
jgi:hypothetical protein